MCNNLDSVIGTLSEAYVKDKKIQALSRLKEVRSVNIFWDY